MLDDDEESNGLRQEGEDLKRRMADLAKRSAAAASQRTGPGGQSKNQRVGAGLVGNGLPIVVPPSPGSVVDVRNNSGGGGAIVGAGAAASTQKVVPPLV